MSRSSDSAITVTRARAATSTGTRWSCRLIRFVTMSMFLSVPSFGAVGPGLLGARPGPCCLVGRNLDRLAGVAEQRAPLFLGVHAAVAVGELSGGRRTTLDDVPQVGRVATRASAAAVRGQLQCDLALEVAEAFGFEPLVDLGRLLGDAGFLGRLDRVDDRLRRGFGQRLDRRGGLLQKALGSQVCVADADLLEVFGAPDDAVGAHVAVQEAGQSEGGLAYFTVPGVEATEVGLIAHLDRVLLVDQE